MSRSRFESVCSIYIIIYQLISSSIIVYGTSYHKELWFVRTEPIIELIMLKPYRRMNTGYFVISD